MRFRNCFVCFKFIGDFRNHKTSKLLFDILFCAEKKKWNEILFWTSQHSVIDGENGVQRKWKISPQKAKNKGRIFYCIVIESLLICVAFHLTIFNFCSQWRIQDPPPQKKLKKFWPRGEARPLRPKIRHCFSYLNANYDFNTCPNLPLTPSKYGKSQLESVMSTWLFPIIAY